ncbi:hypothetical protein A0H81_11724 [Grifola frondosa]|uniref:Uncharacterized protein n=1 Tax=Grifola frondosa TaxID=5627 RepID=A0A1C7LWE5_GRIFR|nr:hypothetical protein A0H81_11724 [Grifola frondosa]
MASAEEIVLNDPHPPTPKAIEAFEVVLHDIKSAIVKSRRDWISTSRDVVAGCRPVRRRTGWVCYSAGSGAVQERAHILWGGDPGQDQDPRCR